MSYSLAFTQAVAVMISIGAGNLFKDIEWVSAAVLSASLAMPRPTVANILGKLLAAGLVESKEGNRGGVRLAVQSSHITLLDIFDAIESKKPLFRTDIALHAKGTEVEAATRKVAVSFLKAEMKMKEELKKIKLDALFGCENETSQ
jgi:Rrf2 family protein